MPFLAAPSLLSVSLLVLRSRSFPHSSSRTSPSCAASPSVRGTLTVGLLSQQSDLPSAERPGSGTLSAVPHFAFTQRSHDCALQTSKPRLGAWAPQQTPSSVLFLARPRHMLITTSLTSLCPRHRPEHTCPTASRTCSGAGYMPDRCQTRADLRHRSVQLSEPRVTCAQLLSLEMRSRPLSLAAQRSSRHMVHPDSDGKDAHTASPELICSCHLAPV